MESESGVGGDIEMAFAMLTAPTLARSKKVGFMANTTVRSADITNIIRIAPAMGF